MKTESKIDCHVVIKRKGNKYLCSYSDNQKFTQEEIDFLSSRNTGDSIIPKLEIIKDAEIGNLGEMTPNEKRWDEIGRICNQSFIQELINELKEIQLENGKIVISKDFKYKIEITTNKEGSV